MKKEERISTPDGLCSPSSGRALSQKSSISCTYHTYCACTLLFLFIKAAYLVSAFLSFSFSLVNLLSIRAIAAHMPKASRFYYAVKRGRTPGVYNSWPECQSQVNGFGNPVFRKFETYQEAADFVGGKGRAKASATAQAAGGRLSNHTATRTTTITTKTTTAATATAATTLTPRAEHVVYTDGAATGNGRDGARAGYGVYWGDDDPRNVSQPLMGSRQTNQRAELQAIISALGQTQSMPGALEIRTDSSYSIKCITEWSLGWAKNGWRNSKKQPVENQDLIKEAIALKQSRAGPTIFTHVRGHAGEYGNEMADRLAVAGARLL